MHFGSFVHVVEDADDSENRRGINALAKRLVVEADVAAGDGNLQFFAGFGDAVDRLRELPHDVGLFGIAEVEAVGRGNRSRAGTCDFAGGLGDGVHRAQARIEIAPASIAVERHGKAALRGLGSGFLMRITPASPAPGASTVLVCTMWSYCCQTQRLPQMFELASNCFKAGV